MRKRSNILWSVLSALFILTFFLYFQGSDRRVSEHEITVSSFVPPALAIAVSGVPIRVARVIDGDTIELASGDHLRYIGIDTPEEVDPRKPVQCFADKAAERNRELVEGKDIIFYKDVSVRDRFGRLLGFVYLPDGTFVNKILVSEGYAFSYRYAPDIHKADELRNAQEHARNAHLGLWAACSVNKLPDGREQTNAIQ